MYQARIPCLLVAIASLVACSSGAEEETSGSAQATPSFASTASQTPLRQANLGPIEYEFDPMQLTRAEVQLPLPPSRAETAFAIKLIPQDAFENLGTMGCSYGISADNVECTAEEEVGVALAMLERPIADYREQFAAAGEDLQPVRIDGHEGFSWTASEADSGLQYSFVPYDGQTVLVVRRFDRASPRIDKAIQTVIRSVNLDG